MRQPAVVVHPRGRPGGADRRGGRRRGGEGRTHHEIARSNDQGQPVRAPRGDPRDPSRVPERPIDERLMIELSPGEYRKED